MPSCMLSPYIHFLSCRVSLSWMDNIFELESMYAIMIWWLSFWYFLEYWSKRVKMHVCFRAFFKDFELFFFMLFILSASPLCSFRFCILRRKYLFLSLPVTYLSLCTHHQPLVIIFFRYHEYLLSLLLYVCVRVCVCVCLFVMTACLSPLFAIFSLQPFPIGWGCRIHRLHLCRG